MKIVYPIYYKKFKCIAQNCEDTCCAGWDIVVDESSADFYKSVTLPIGETIRNAMDIDSDGDIIFPLQNGRCPFLNNCNLCDIYFSLGENALCHTCKKFPRFVEEYGSVREEGLGLACPEAARIIVGFEEENRLDFEMNDDFPLPNDIDPEYYFSLITLRKNMFSILGDTTVSIKEKLMKMLSLAGDTGPEIPRVDKCKNILKKLDVLTEKWNNLLNIHIEEKPFPKNEIPLLNIAWYYIYRYLLKAVFDGKPLPKVRLCVLAVVIINAYSDEGSIADIAHLFSKEAEYSQKNIDLILKELENENVF